MGKPQELAAALNKTLGEGTVLMGSDPSLLVTQLSTGILPVDVLLGGGVPRGRSTEAYGSFSSLKSLIAYRLLASAQRAGETAVLVDTEHAYDPVWGEENGIDNKTLIIQRPPTAEDAIKVMEVALKNEVGALVWDSVAASFPKQQAEKMPGEDLQVAALARVMSNGMRRLTAANSKTAFFIINQTRVNVGVTFGSNTATPGGKALGFYASQRIQMIKAGKIKRKVKIHDGEKTVEVDEVVALKIKAVLEKSKLNKPHREMWFQFDQETGEIDQVSFIISQGLEHGFITQGGGGYWTIPEYLEDKVQGKANFKEWLASDQDALDWCTERVWEAQG